MHFIEQADERDDTPPENTFIPPVTAGGVTLGGYEAKRVAAEEASENGLTGTVLRASDSTLKYILSQQL